ncbi:MAG: N-acetyl-1-D-myo-inositol-2-amino-2-deoxy-alpha-D-glucopyranoside deacetylase [Actinobacteria bacterium]|nr:N-acetyl-1-D-myo-inositol-2-amino-2-deoxy-alpha-D-glucopyranoside deacetylase [Actinomycetota bacterium]
MTAPTEPAPTARLLFVHAHPDDETINNGATMARYSAAGAHVTLVTCTRGEEGEIIPADLAHLASDRDDTLGDHRVGELADAMSHLGVHDHRFLDRCGADGGSPLRYRDSGMAWGPEGVAVPAPDTKPGAFALADVDEAAARLADVVREVRPQVLATYDPQGGYGHPDHVQAHRVAMRAVELAAAPAPGPDGEVPGWDVPKVYWVCIPEGLMRETLRRLDATGDNPFEGMSPDGPLPSMVVADELVTSAVDGSAYVDAKSAALRAHATQINVEGPFFALSNGVGQPLAGFEFYRLVKGTPAGPFDENGRETDLLAGA